jgi:sterol desaturase/sphingolipid hydroxylase (fatty acid hydroxylase superfamily)
VWYRADVASWTARVALAPLLRLFNPFDAFNLAALYAAFCFAALWCAARRPSRWKGRLDALVRATRRRSWWWSRSSRLDLQLYVVTSAFYATGAFGFLGADAVRRWEDGALADVLGATRPWAVVGGGWAAIAAATVAEVLLYDLAYWFAHFTMHRIPILWEFHKLHHSAEVLTPMTEWRQHPLELVWFPLSTALVMGSGLALQDQVLGTGVVAAQVLGANALTTLGVYTILHLRHSPAHHQIHHSTNPAHFDKNLGLFLSVWDWLFGTLYVPERPEPITLGISARRGASTTGWSGCSWTRSGRPGGA